MNWLDKLERRLGRFAIQNLMSYIIVAHVAILILSNFMPQVAQPLAFKLMLIPELVWQGEIWRLITFIFIPPSINPLLGAFVLYFYYSISNSLEAEWGSFKFNIYYFIGVIGTAAVSMVFNTEGTPDFLNLTLFLAYAKIFSEAQIRLYFLIPIKVKYLGWVYWILLIPSLIFSGWGGRMIILVSLANYFLFFGRTNIRAIKTKNQVAHRQREFKKDRPTVIHIHRCSVCGITDRDNPDIEFRYCSKCDGRFEYCADHIFDHEHK
ncbi:MAG TPA: rhomboid family intramembrane serine protease [Epulopiscium sp.]|nr:rhomboid family intramembrane serine protease [Candidatus Epulonipiscium sp.]